MNPENQNASPMNPESNVSQLGLNAEEAAAQRDTNGGKSMRKKQTSTTDSLFASYFRECDGDRPRMLEMAFCDLWKNYPEWPSTFGPCRNADCFGSGRGSGFCARCVVDSIAEIVGDSLAASGLHRHIVDVRAEASKLRDLVSHYEGERSVMKLPETPDCNHAAQPARSNTSYGVALLRRLQNYRASMAPHHKNRNDGKLLIEAAAEIDRLIGICTHGHDLLLRGGDDMSLLAKLAEGWRGPNDELPRIILRPQISETL